MSTEECDIKTIYFLRSVMRLGLLSACTYHEVGGIMICRRNMDRWRTANWKEFLQSG